MWWGHTELKNLAMATRVATSTESVSFPKRNGPWTEQVGRVGDSSSSCCLNASFDKASEDISSKLWMGSIEMELRTCFKWLLRILPSVSGKGGKESPIGAYTEWTIFNTSNIIQNSFFEVPSWNVFYADIFRETKWNIGSKEDSEVIFIILWLYYFIIACLRKTEVNSEVICWNLEASLWSGVCWIQ